MRELQRGLREAEGGLIRLLGQLDAPHAWPAHRPALEPPLQALRAKCQARALPACMWMQAMLEGLKALKAPCEQACKVTWTLNPDPALDA